MMPSEKTPLFTSLQPLSFLPDSKTNSPNSGAGKALRSAVKTIPQAPGCLSTCWGWKLPDRDSIVLVTTWSHESDEVEFFTSETWASALRNLKDYLLPSTLSSLTSSREKDNIRFPETHSVGGPFKPCLAREHEILIFKFPVNVSEERISEFNSRVSNLRDGLFNNIGAIDAGKPRLRGFSGGWVPCRSGGDGESAFKSYVAFMSWDDESTKKDFKAEDVDWCHFLGRVNGIFEGGQVERFAGRLREVRSERGNRYSFDSETEDEE